MGFSKAFAFTFRERFERIDWKQLASVDIDKVAKDVDITTLQKNTANVTFCDIEAEIINIDQNFVKLFRLSQLIIQYLMYSQECLTETISTLEKELNDVKKQFEDDFKKRSTKKKPKTLEKNPESAIQVKCFYCPKYFINQTYLQLHVQRRHLTVDVNDEKLKKEMIGIKQKLEKAQTNLQEERLKNQAKRLQEQLVLETKDEEIKRLKAMKNEECDEILKRFLTEIESLNTKVKINNDILEAVNKLKIEFSNKSKIEDVKLDYESNQHNWQQQYNEIETLNNLLETQVIELKKITAGLRNQQLEFDKRLKTFSKDSKLTL